MSTALAVAHYYGHGSGWYWLGVWLWHRVHWWTLGIMPVIVVSMAFLSNMFGRRDE